MTKLPLDQMQFLFEAGYETFMKTLFEDKAKEHGWTEDEFFTAVSEQEQAIADGKIQRWVN
jgi:hypothetical protein